MQPGSWREHGAGRVIKTKPQWVAASEVGNERVSIAPVDCNPARMAGTNAGSASDRGKAARVTASELGNEGVSNFEPLHRDSHGRHYTIADDACIISRLRCMNGTQPGQLEQFASARWPRSFSLCAARLASPIATIFFARTRVTSRGLANPPRQRMCRVRTVAIVESLNR
jgi:hypothetical protein